MNDEQIRIRAGVLSKDCRYPWSETAIYKALLLAPDDELLSRALIQNDLEPEFYIRHTEERQLRERVAQTAKSLDTPNQMNLPL